MQRNPARVLRELLNGSEIIVKPGAFDALSAQIIERAGFKSLGLSGYAISATLLGRPDVGLTTMTEVVNVCRHVASAVKIPIIADADTGYGNAINVLRTVEEFIRAGAAGVHIEDQVAPKRCGHVAGKQIISVDEACGKYRAAAHVRGELNSDFVIIARTDARGVPGGSVDDVIRRSNAYLDAGADMVFPEGLLSVEELKRVCSEVRGPIHYNRTGVSPMLPLPELQACGVKMVSNATGMLRAAASAMWDYMHAFKQDDVRHAKSFLANLEGHPVGNFHDFMGFTEYRKLEDEFLPAEEARKYDGSLGFTP
jgi:2-methylisocitrate lyase-like PEP mutase family enzyme